ncbi:MAG: SSU ribosomal protein S20p, partial [uncultured Solirubrobacteraceae bacterium]
GQHSLTEEAHPPRRARAAREPPLHLDDQDVLPSPRGRRRRRGRDDRRRRLPPPAGHDRQGRQAGRPAQEHRRPQEGPRRPRPRRPHRGL